MRAAGTDPRRVDLESVAAVLIDMHGTLVDSAATVDLAPPWQDRDTADVVATAGALDLLQTLDALGIRWAVITGKPEPDGHRRAADLLGVPPARCLVVEDAVAGIDAARAAGIPTAALRGLPGDLVIRDLGHLAHLLHRCRTQPWWRDAVGYQVYLPSFADTDGDGWGDLPGVTAHLDHLVDLGVDVLWLTPFFASPMRDHGYDISDYRAVDARYGGDEALADLLDAAHRRGLRVIGDLVVNHTSSEHPWFRAARTHPGGPYRDYYLWRSPRPDGTPPNNWLSHFGGPAWTRDDTTGEYYLHLFHPEQPDLNWRNPAVAEEIDEVIRHWLDRGLDGFRVDTADCLVKHPELLDNPPRPAGELSPVRGVARAWREQDHRYDVRQPDVHAVHTRWRRVTDRCDGFLVGEVYELDPAALAAFVDTERLHSSFWFGLVETDWDPQRFHDMLRAAAQASPRLSWVQGNHDRSRAATRYGGGRLGRRRSLALHVLTSVLPGTFWLYQGEELGLEDGHVPSEHAQDPLGAAEPGQSRDGARTPMPWQPGPGLGFTKGRAWLAGGDRSAAETASAQARDPESHLATLTRLLRTRRWAQRAGTLPDDATGGCEVVVDDVPHAPDAAGDGVGLQAYRRGGLWAVANLTDTTTSRVRLPAPVVFDTDDAATSPRNPVAGPRSLQPQQSLLLAGGT